MREDLRGFPFESTTGVEGVLEMPEADGERGSLGVELREFLEEEGMCETNICSGKSGD